MCDGEEMYVMETQQEEQRSDCPTHCNWVVWVASPTLFTSLMVGRTQSDNTRRLGSRKASSCANWTNSSCSEEEVI